MFRFPHFDLTNVTISTLASLPKLSWDFFLVYEFLRNNPIELSYRRLCNVYCPSSYFGSYQHLNSKLLNLNYMRWKPKWDWTVNPWLKHSCSSCQGTVRESGKYLMWMWLGLLDSPVQLWIVKPTWAYGSARLDSMDDEIADMYSC